MIQQARLHAFARRYSEALDYAAKKHAKQLRKGTRIPYIAHPIAVSSLVLEHGGGEDEAIAALLHDILEDCGGRPVLEEIRRKFGKNVAQIVAGCTDTLETPKPPWKERKEEYIAHVRKANRSTRLVSAADKFHNARSILSDYRDLGEKVWKKKDFSGGKAGQLWYYRALVYAFEDRGRSDHLVRELDRVVTEIERLAEVRPGASQARRRRRS